MPRWRRCSSVSMRLSIPDVEGAAIGRDMDGARPSDPKAQALHVTTLLDVLELIWIVIRAEQRVLWPDRRYVEGRRHERPVHHDGRADAVDARRVHDPFLVDGDRLRAAFPRRVDDVGEIGRVTDRLVDVPRRDAHVARVVELHDDTVAALRRESGRRLQLVEAGLELLRGATLRGGVPLDLVQPGAELGELPFEVVLLRLQSVRGVDERCVVADGELAALGLCAPLKRDEQPEEDGRHEEHEGVLQLPRSWRGSACHALKCPTPSGMSRAESRAGGAGENRTPDAGLRTAALFPLSYSPASA